MQHVGAMPGEVTTAIRPSREVLGNALGSARAVLITRIQLLAWRQVPCTWIPVEGLPDGPLKGWKIGAQVRGRAFCVSARKAVVLLWGGGNGLIVGIGGAGLA